MPSAVCYLSEVNRTTLTERIEAWKSEFPEMGVLALLPEWEKHAVTILQRVCSDAGVSLTGGIFPELIDNDRFIRQGCLLLRFDQAPFYVLKEHLPRDSEGAQRVMETVAGQIRENISKDDGEATLFLLFDAMVPNISTLLDEVYLKLANRVHYAGANAGSETFQPMPCLFDNQRLVGDGMLAILIKRHNGAILEHGYQLPAKSYTATASDGNRITYIDWRPAFEVYCELVQAQYGVKITRDNFYQYAAHFPFGIVRANHNVLVRIPVAVGDDGSVTCVGEVPAHSVLSLLEAPPPGSHVTVDSLLERLATLNGGIAGHDLLLFYCAGRRMHLGAEAAEAEVHDMGQRGKVRQITGALSLGEIGASSLRGYPLFHNATLVTALW